MTDGTPPSAPRLLKMSFLRDLAPASGSTSERARDPERAARMAAALDACRASARRDEHLTFERLSVWQAIVLGKPAAASTA